jgi:propanediol utilization protein
LGKDSYQVLRTATILSLPSSISACKKISVLIKGERSVILNNVVVRVGDFDTRLQIDTDEGNAVGLVNNQKVFIYEK